MADMFGVLIFYHKRSFVILFGKVLIESFKSFSYFILVKIGKLLVISQDVEIGIKVDEIENC